MATKKEKQLATLLLKERLEHLTGKKVIFKEGNPISNKLPGDIDDALMDIAQMTNKLTYGNIIRFNPSLIQLNQLKRLCTERRGLIKAGSDENDLDLIGLEDRIIAIVKGVQN